MEILNNKRYKCLSEYKFYYREYCLEFFKTLGFSIKNNEKIVEFCLNLECENINDSNLKEVYNIINNNSSKSAMDVVKTVFSYLTLIFLLLFLLIRWVDKYIN